MKVIINVDDVGITDSVNRSVDKLADEGVIDSISLMPAAPCTQSALDLARKHDLPVGVHLTATVTRPLTDSVLQKGQTYFPNSYAQFIRAYMTGAIRKNDLLYEWKRQIQRVVDHGLRISHLDSHEHVHMLPSLFCAALSLAKQYNVTAIRTTNEYMQNDNRGFLRLGAEWGLKLLGQYATHKARDNGLRCADWFIGANLNWPFDPDRITKAIHHLRTRKNIGVNKESEPLVEVGVHTADHYQPNHKTYFAHGPRGVCENEKRIRTLRTKLNASGVTFVPYDY